MLNILLTAIIDSWELILRDFKFEQLHECSTKSETALLGMFIGIMTGRLKNEVKKSR
jgi:hypothetical protein